MKVYLSLGSNLGNKKKNIDRAIRKINDLAGSVLRSSNYHISKPWGYKSNNTFVNVAILIETNYNPHDLLLILKNIEIQMGRKEKSQNKNYSDRIIDIDILLYENLSINTPDLIIPHPLMKERDFVMIPLSEILPNV